MILHLSVVAGPQAGAEFEVPEGREVVVGRARPSSLVIADGTISKAHCRILNIEGMLIIEDLKSRNGIRINDTRVEKGPLKEGDVIQIGKTRIKVSLRASPAPVPVAPAPSPGDRKEELAATLHDGDPSPSRPELPPALADAPKAGAPRPAAADAPEAEVNFGKIALMNKMITKEQLAECLRIQKGMERPAPLGEILVEKGFLDPGQRDLLLKIQTTDKGVKRGDVRAKKQEQIFAKIAIQKGYVDEKQVKDCMSIQKQCMAEGLPMRLDELLVKKGYLTKDQMEEILTQQGAEGLGVQIKGYEIQSIIGHGGMGAVYKARQVSMDRMVAIKVLADKFKEKEGYAERFLREARSVAKLNHENIISGIDFGQVGDLSYFVMEYVEGQTVLDILRDTKRITPERALDIVLQVSRALEHAHKKNLIHRDIKPDNIMISENGIVKLCDLGLAKSIGKDADGSLAGKGLGTANYMSPEQIEGRDDMDIRTDIYSLGATFYRMVFGGLPFKGSSPAVIMSRHLKEPLSFPEERMDPIVKAIAGVIAKMMEKDRERRYADPTQLIDALDKVKEASKAPGTRRTTTQGATEDGSSSSKNKRPILRKRRRRRGRRF